MATKAPHHTDALDAQLVLRAERGDRDAFVELFRRHAKPAWRLSLAVGGSAEIAADAVAKGFTLTLVRLHRRTTTLAVPFRHLVTRTSGEAAASASRRDDSPADPAPNDLAEAFLALPERWRGALWLTLVEGGTPPQVAPIVGLSEEGTASLVDRACAGLRARYGRSTPLGAYLLGDCSDAKPKLRALAVPMPATLEARAVTQWQAWQRTLVTEKRRGLASVMPLPSWADRAVSAAAVAVFAAGIAVALNHEATTASHAPMVALPITRNSSSPTSMTYTPAAFYAAPTASPTRVTSRGDSVRGQSTQSTQSAVTTPTTIADAAAAGADAGTGNENSTTTSTPPADTKGASTPNAGASTTVGGTPVAITVGTDGVGATVGDTSIGSTTTTTAPSSGSVTVIVNPGGGLDPIGVTLP